MIGVLLGIAVLLSVGVLLGVRYVEYVADRRFGSTSGKYETDMDAFESVIRQLKTAERSFIVACADCGLRELPDAVVATLVAAIREAAKNGVAITMFTNKPAPPVLRELDKDGIIEIVRLRCAIPFALRVVDGGVSVERQIGVSRLGRRSGWVRAENAPEVASDLVSAICVA